MIGLHDKLLKIRNNYIIDNLICKEKTVGVSYGRLESCKSNNNLLLCNMEISGRFVLSTLKV